MIFRRFLKERKSRIGMYAGFLGIFFLIFYLYDVRSDAMKYAFLLSFVWLLIVGIGDYVHFRKRHEKLAMMKEAVTLDPSLLPQPSSLAEEDYQTVICRLYEQKVDMESSQRIFRQEMSDYYSMWVHQIKTPLSAMHVLIQSREKEEMAAPYMKEMKRELFKTEQYVEMVLTYLRMEDMSGDLAFEEYDLDDIVKQAVRKYSQMFILQKMKLNYEPLGEKVLTDEKWLLFVIEQILSNALKYSLSCEARQPAISIYMADETKGCKVLVIEDEGIGIQPEDLPRVFERGFTGYNGRADKKSTGIGLYLCKRVMDRLHHRIWIESEVDHGTKVYLELGREYLETE